MRICHVIPYLGRAQGGPVRSLAAYVEVLASRGHEIAVAAVPRPGDGPRLALPEEIEPRICAQAMPGNFRFCPELPRKIMAFQPALVHSHGLWTYAGLAAAKAARRLRIPHVLAPCGMLQHGALQRSRWKKRLCRWLFQDRVLRDAACLHAKSKPEADGLRTLGLKGRIDIIPNPVPVPAELPRPEPPGNDRDDRRTVLFLGRLHPVKGVPRLIEAWLAIAPRHPTWRLVIAGPDEANLREPLQQRLAAAGRAGSVAFPGPLEGDDKWSALARAELFVMPSDFENFGTAIVEAMRCGKPIVTTTGTPWEELPEHQAGWWVEPTADAIAGALNDAMSMPAEQRASMGEQARRLGDVYAPEAVGSRLETLYRSLTGK